MKKAITLVIVVLFTANVAAIAWLQLLPKEPARLEEMLSAAQDETASAPEGYAEFLQETAETIY